MQFCARACACCIVNVRWCTFSLGLYIVHVVRGCAEDLRVQVALLNMNGVTEEGMNQALQNQKFYFQEWLGRTWMCSLSTCATPLVAEVVAIEDDEGRYIYIVAIPLYVGCCMRRSHIDDSVTAVVWRNVITFV